MTKQNNNDNKDKWENILTRSTKLSDVNKDNIQQKLYRSK